MKKIFISYGHDSNKNVVDRIKTDIENIKNKNGIQKFICWIDSEELRASDNWELSIEKAIEESDIVLFFITPYSTRRPNGYCLKELSYAVNITNTPIIPIMIEEEKTPISICQLQYVDLLDLNLYNEKLQEIFNALENPIEVEFSNTLILKNRKLFNPIDFKYLILRYIKDFEGRNWIDEKINDWLIKINSKVLWITAEAGYGKSAIASYLADRHPSAVGVHFCQYYSDETKNPINIIKTFAYQLSTQFLPYSKALEALLQDNEFIYDINNTTNVHDLFIKLLVNPLRLLKSDKPLFFIIDAIDEADNQINNSILDMISREFNQLPSWLKVVILSRPESYIRTKFLHLNPLELRADNTDNINDLRNYIKTKSNSKKLLLNEQQIDEIIKKSEGIFLYIKEVLAGLDSSTISSNKPIEFPIGLNGIYLQYFQRKFPNQMIYEKNQLDFVSLIVEGYVPFEIDLLIYILDSTERDIYNLIESFGSYIKVINNKVSFFHKSIYDWLNSKESHFYMINKKRANRLISKRLWKYYIEKNNQNLNYHIFLLNSIFYEKKLKKLNKILQDILFIGEIYNNKTHKYYIKILKKIIKNYSSSISTSELSIYESFFRENEHLILHNNDINWTANQNLFALAYADGENSPLSNQSDELLKQNKINFYWFKDLNRNKKFKRTGLVKVLEGHTDSVQGAIKLQNNKIASWGNDESFRIWDIENKQNNEKIEINSCIYHIYIINKNKLLIQGKNIALQIFDITNNHLEILLNTYTYDYKCIPGIKLLKNNKIIIYDIWYKFFQVFDLDNRTILDSGRIDDFNFINDYTILYWSSNEEYLINIWDMNYNNNKVLKGHNRKIIEVIKLKNGKVLSLSEDGDLIIWNLGENLESKLLKNINGLLFGMTELKDNHIVTYSRNMLILWKLEDNDILFLDTFDNDCRINRVKKLKNDKLLLVLNEFKSTKLKLKIYDFFGKNYYRILKIGDSINTIWELDDHKILYESNEYKIWDFDDFTESVIQIGRRSSGLRIPRIISDNNIAFDKNCGELKVFDLKNNHNSKSFYAHNGEILDVFMLNERELLTCSEDNTLKIWDIDSTPIINNNEDVNIIPNNKEFIHSTLMYTFNNTTLEIWDLQNRDNHNKILEGHSGTIKGTITLKNKTLLSWSEDDSLRVWDLENEQNCKILIGHKNSVLGAIELQDKRILSWSEDDSLRVWDLENEFSCKVSKIDLCRSSYVKELENGKVLIFEYLHLGGAQEVPIIWDINNDYWIELQSDDEIDNVLCISNNKIVTYSYNTIITIWSLNNLSKIKLSGHKSGIKNVIELFDGKLLSYCENSIVIWNLINMQKSNIFEISNEKIEKVKQLTTDTLLVITEIQFHLVKINAISKLSTNFNLPIKYNYDEISISSFDKSKIYIFNQDKIKTYSLYKGGEKTFLNEVLD